VLRRSYASAARYVKNLLKTFLSKAINVVMKYENILKSLMAIGGEASMAASSGTHRAECSRRGCPSSLRPRHA
jgi:hypothetical protein